MSEGVVRAVRAIGLAAALLFMVWVGAAGQSASEKRHANEPLAIVGFVQCDKYAGTVIIDKAGHVHGASPAELSPEQAWAIAKKLGPDNNMVAKGCGSVTGHAPGGPGSTDT